MDSISSSPKKLAEEIKSLAGVKLYAKPYNRFMPDDSVWWLIPSNEYPAYKYGKLFFETRDNSIFCGYYLEKGVNTKDGSYSDSSQIANDWIWNEFMGNLISEDKKLFDIFKKLASKKLKNYIAISIGLVSPSKYEDSESAENFRKDFNPSRIEFEIDNNTGLFFQEEKVEINEAQNEIVKFISEQKKETNLSELALKLNSEKPSALDWSWIDVYCGTYLKQSDIDIIYLWREYLGEWEPWLRKHEI